VGREAVAKTKQKMAHKYYSLHNPVSEKHRSRDPACATNKINKN